MPTLTDPLVVERLHWARTLRGLIFVDRTPLSFHYVVIDPTRAHYLSNAEQHKLYLNPYPAARARLASLWTAWREEVLPHLKKLGAAGRVVAYRVVQPGPS